MLDLGLFLVLLGGLCLAWGAVGFLRGEPTIAARRLERVRMLVAGVLIAGGSLLQVLARIG